METHRCRRKKRRGEECVTIFEKMKVIYRGGVVKKKGGKGINAIKNV